MSDELIAIQKMDMVSVFTNSDSLDKILLKIRETALSEVQSVETSASRKAIASMAYKVSQSKIGLDNAGKNLVADWKMEIKKIDDSRKKARDYLDNLRDEVRKKLTDWEIAAKKKEEKKRADAAFEKAWDDAHAEHELFLRKKAIEKKEAEFARQQAEDAAEENRLREEEKKAANINHQKKINNIILKGFMEEGFTEAQGKKIITAIFSGRIKHVTINY